MTNTKNNNPPVQPTPPSLPPADKETTEQGGQKGPEPTRYGDWEKGGRCTDF